VLQHRGGSTPGRKRGRQDGLVSRWRCFVFSQHPLFPFVRSALCAADPHTPKLSTPRQCITVSLRFSFCLRPSPAHAGICVPVYARISFRHLCRLLRETFEPEQLTGVSIFDGSEPTQAVVEVGPRTNFSTAWSTNATSICSSVGLDKVRASVCVLLTHRLEGKGSTGGHAQGRGSCVCSQATRG
jgi:hypothetical protein